MRPAQIPRERIEALLKEHYAVVVMRRKHTGRGTR